MIDVFEKAGGPVLAVERVPIENVSSYGVIAGEPVDARALAQVGPRLRTAVGAASAGT